MTIGDLYKQSINEILENIKDYKNEENNKIIDNIYQSIIQNIETSERYKNLIHKYNKVFYSIEDEELREKIASLNELKNNIYAEYDEILFKIGFSTGVKTVIEALCLKG